MHIFSGSATVRIYLYLFILLAGAIFSGCKPSQRQRQAEDNIMSTPLASGQPGLPVIESPIPIQNVLELIERHFPSSERAGHSLLVTFNTAWDLESLNDQEQLSNAIKSAQIVHLVKNVTIVTEASGDVVEPSNLRMETTVSLREAGLRVLPTRLLIDEQSSVRAVYTGYVSHEKILADLARLPSP